MEFSSIIRWLLGDWGEDDRLSREKERGEIREGEGESEGEGGRERGREGDREGGGERERGREGGRDGERE